MPDLGLSWQDAQGPNRPSAGMMESREVPAVREGFLAARTHAKAPAPLPLS